MRLRDQCKTYGLTLSKTRVRDESAADYGLWSVATDKKKVLMTFDLDDVEAYLITEYGYNPRPRT